MFLLYLAVFLILIHLFLWVWTRSLGVRKIRRIMNASEEAGPENDINWENVDIDGSMVMFLIHYEYWIRDLLFTLIIISIVGHLFF